MLPNKPKLPTPDGFVAVLVEDRVCYTAKYNPTILRHHEELREYLLQTYGHKANFPNQTTCLAAHKKNRFFLKVDLADAFGSIDSFGAGVVLNLPTLAEEYYKHFFHEQGGLIQGAPCSPLLFNLYFQATAEPDLQKWATQHGFTWTRYVDDMLFSRNKFIESDILQSLKKLLSRHGFVIRKTKTRLADSFRQEISYLGAVIYRKRFDVSDEFKEKLRLAKSAGSDDELGRLRVWQKKIQYFPIAK